MRGGNAVRTEAAHPVVHVVHRYEEDVRRRCRPRSGNGQGERDKEFWDDSNHLFGGRATTFGLPGAESKGRAKLAGSWVSVIVHQPRKTHREEGICEPQEALPNEVTLQRSRAIITKSQDV